MCVNDGSYLGLPTHIFDAYPIVVASIIKARYKDKGMGRASERARKREKKKDFSYARDFRNPSALFRWRVFVIMRVLRAQRHKYIRGGSSGRRALPSKCERKLR